MIEHVKIGNFRCLKSVGVPLRPLTVLIGPNDSGKSVFLSAVYNVVESTHFAAEDSWRYEREVRVDVKAKVGTSALVLSSVDRRKNSDDPSIMKPVARYHLPSTGVNMVSEGYPDVGAPPEITPDGGNIPALLDHYIRRDRKRFDQVITAMRDLVGGFEDIQISTPKPETRRIDFMIEGGLRISADQTSVGVRLILFFVALAYHPTPPKLILLEEPENCVHPKRLADVMRLLREITQGKHGGHAAQVILTTHSPYLLDQVDLATDQVLVFKRNDDGSRSAEPADAERLKSFLGEFMLGEVWFNEGEAGLVSRES